MSFKLTQQQQSDITATLTASELHIGQVGGEGITTTVTPTLSVAGRYAANDFVGTSATAMTFANAVRVSGGSGVIETAILVDGEWSAGMKGWVRRKIKVSGNMRKLIPLQTHNPTPDQEDLRSKIQAVTD